MQSRSWQQCRLQNHQNHEIIQNVIENNLPVKLLNQNHLNYQKGPLELLLKIICRYCGQALGYCAQDSCDKSSSGRALGGVRLFIEIIFIIFCIGFHQVMIWLNLSFHHLFNIGERWRPWLQIVLGINSEQICHLCSKYIFSPLL